MTEKSLNEINMECSKLALAEVIRNKKINCKIHKNNCLICLFGKSGKCEMNEARDKLQEIIKNGI